MKVPSTINVIDVQVAGETGRVLLDQCSLVQGNDMVSRLKYCRDHLGALRQAVLREPRGHANLMGAIVVPPVASDSDFGVIIMEQADYAPMSGANLMCAVTAVLETQQVGVTEPVTELAVDTASGTVKVCARVHGGRVTEITIDSVLSFAAYIEHKLDVPEYGELVVDIGFGGQFYVQAPASAFGLELHASQAPELIRAANLLLATARECISVVHPTMPHLDQINLPMLYADSANDSATTTGLVVMPIQQPSLSEPTTWNAGTVDRSPGGTGTCARMAVEYAKGNLRLGEEFVQRSLLETTFTGRLEERFVKSDHVMLRPSLTGRGGWVTGYSQLVIAPDDPFPQGFSL